MALRSYRELDVWQRAMELAEAVYHATRDRAKHERFGMISQAQRAAPSVAFNIAEGYGRLYRREHIKHRSYARGSLNELESQVILGTRVGVAQAAPLRPVWVLSQRVGKMLTRHINALMQMDPEAPIHATAVRRSTIKRSPTPHPTVRNRKRASAPRLRTRDPKPETRNPTHRRSSPVSTPVPAP